VWQSCAEHGLQSTEVDLSLDTGLAAIQAVSGDPESQRLVRELRRLVNHIRASLTERPVRPAVAPFPA